MSETEGKHLFSYNNKDKHTAFVSGPSVSLWFLLFLHNHSVWSSLADGNPPQWTLLALQMDQVSNRKQIRHPAWSFSTRWRSSFIYKSTKYPIKKSLASWNKCVYSLWTVTAKWGLVIAQRCWIFNSLLLGDNETPWKPWKMSLFTSFLLSKVWLLEQTNAKR